MRNPLWNATYAPMLMKGPRVEVRERQWREAFAKPDGWFSFVVENSSGELVGFAQGAVSEQPEYGGELNEICLLRACQRMGLGRRLIGHVARLRRLAGICDTDGRRGGP
jgi:GNAT superfamily N-acetyltransferase